MLPTAMDMDGTQLPCSPSQLLNTDAALQTLKEVDDHEKAVEEQVHWYHWQDPFIIIDHIYDISYILLYVHVCREICYITTILSHW